MQNKDGERGGIRRLPLVKSVRKNVVCLVWYPNIYNCLIFTNHVHMYLCAHVPSHGSYFFLSTWSGLPHLREIMHGLSCFFSPTDLGSLFLAYQLPCSFYYAQISELLNWQINFEGGKNGRKFVYQLNEITLGRSLHSIIL